MCKLDYLGNTTCMVMQVLSDIATLEFTVGGGLHRDVEHDLNDTEMKTGSANVGGLTAFLSVTPRTTMEGMWKTTSKHAETGQLVRKEGPRSFAGTWRSVQSLDTARFECGFFAVFASSTSRFASGLHQDGDGNLLPSLKRQLSHVLDPSAARLKPARHLVARHPRKMPKVCVAQPQPHNL